MSSRELQLAGWWVGQCSLRVTAGYERERVERLNEARERLDRKETAGEVATDVATGISKSLPRKVGASGFEPPTSWSRTRRANRAALRPELLDAQTRRRTAQPRPSLCVCCVCRVCASSLMRPGGLEPPASWSVAKRSIQLSYGRHSFPAGIESTDGQTVRQRARETSRRRDV